MAAYQGRSKRKNTGSKYRAYRKKKLHELGREVVELRVGEKRVKKIKGMGNTSKRRALLLKEANVLNPSTKKFEKSEIIQVKENSANPHYVRRNTITKGAVIETKAGLVKVLNRPGQEGFINAVLVKKE